MHLFLYISLYFSISIYIYIYFYTHIYLFIFLYLYLSISFSLYFFIYLSLFLSLFTYSFYFSISLFLYFYLYPYLYIHISIHIDLSPIIYKYIKEEKKEPTLTEKKQGKPGEFRNSPGLKEEDERNRGEEGGEKVSEQTMNRRAYVFIGHNNAILRTPCIFASSSYNRQLPFSNKISEVT